MKVLIVDNNPLNRKAMNKLLRQQEIIFINGLLEAPNRIMGAMLLEAIEFDLVILGGGLKNILPDGTTDVGNGVALAKQLLTKNNQSNVVLWSDSFDLKAKFEDLLIAHNREALPHYCWQKNLSISELEFNLSMLYQSPLAGIKSQSIHIK